MDLRFSKNIEEKNRKILLLILLMIALLLNLFACNITKISTDSAKLVVCILTEDNSGIIAENISLRNNADTTQIFNGKIRSNRIVFTKLKYGSYSLFIGTQIFEENIRVFTNNIVHNIVVDPAKYKHRTITFQNSSPAEIFSIIVTRQDLRYTNSFTEAILPENIYNGNSYNFVVLDDYPIKHAIFLGTKGVFYAHNIEQKEVVVIRDNRPSLIIVFCSQMIDSAIGEIDIFYNDDGIVQIGVESFDRIAREFMFYEIIPNLPNITGSWTLGLSPDYLDESIVKDIYPLNIFGINYYYHHHHNNVIDALLNDDSVLTAQSLFYVF